MCNKYFMTDVKKFGYARVSTEDQSMELQVRALKTAGCADGDIFCEKKSGATFKRKQLDLLHKHLRPGDTMVVWKLDRLGRDSVELQRFVKSVMDEGVHFEVLQDHIDTSTAGGKFAFQVLCALAEMERNIASERTKAGMAVARSNGKTFGRPSKITGQLREDIMRDLQDVSRSVAEIADHYGYAPNTLNNHFPGVRKAALVKAGKRKP